MDKFIKLVNGELTESVPVASSSGATDANKIVQTDASGKLDVSLMPVGIGSETDDIMCSENLSNGNFVNIHAVGGVIKCRKADASTSGKEAHGFVMSGYTTGDIAKVYRISQSNTQLTGKTVGAKQYLSVTTAGSTQETVPTGSGQVVQFIGIAISATTISFMPKDPITLA